MRDANQADARVRVTVDGHVLEMPAGATVAAALATHAGIAGTRTSVTGMPRTALCGMGVCQECRVTIDGCAHRLACQTLCRDGQTIETAGSSRDAGTT
ncbi:2Fe-2S iron-sulfur cluster-binding protein [Paraburkholderia sp. SARCC-3016]|uniref:2Fe-2S iron-sulfur cluster-binding protein n=1 Tax=Paraburkholderia sp. SARCC-3016 TaxID=3058611 RepID=UPI002809D424|nr:2Fe-2S iron-sulfur cluster-binding protein [Paraburkholderia sp. SARCC-3016]MDQ7976399.1 2Fe-2S iron-sulfur cluster-binding protein [Paraburkholderia sp. SARCC-3016]